MFSHSFDVFRLIIKPSSPRYKKLTVKLKIPIRITLVIFIYKLTFREFLNRQHEVILKFERKDNEKLTFLSLSLHTLWILYSEQREIV